MLWISIRPHSVLLAARPPEAIGQRAGVVLSNWSDLVERYRDVPETRSEIVLGEDENPRTFDLHLSQLRDKHGRLNGRLIILRDITMRKQAEEVLQKAHQQLEKRVEERTAELSIANEKLKKEVEDRVRAEESLKESLMLIGRVKREWESTADSLPQLICLLDNRGNILRTNRTVERWNLGKVLTNKGRSFHDLLHAACWIRPVIWRASGKGHGRNWARADPLTVRSPIGR